MGEKQPYNRHGRLDRRTGTEPCKMHLVYIFPTDNTGSNFISQVHVDCVVTVDSKTTFACKSMIVTRICLILNLLESLNS